MGDYKIHPAPSHHPSAPPASHSRHSSLGADSSMSSIALQMPDDHTLRREQEQSLMHSDGAAAGVQQKDFVYKMPQPLRPDHPSVRAARRARKQGRCCCGRSCCCCCCIILAVIATIIIILGIAALVLYLVLQPKTPDFSVTDATIASFQLTPQPSSAANAVEGASFYLNADVTFNVTAENPNKKIGIYYDAVDVTLFYGEKNIGQGSIPAFYQGHRNTTVLLLRMRGEDVGLTPALGDALRRTLADVDGSVALHSRTLTKVRVKVGSWKSRTWKFQVDCDVQISNPTAPNPRLLSKSCSFKIKDIIF